MTNNVVDFAAVRAQREEEEVYDPHAAGEFYCIGCKHEWVGIAPVPTTWVECPECGTQKGTPLYPFGAGEDEPMLVCTPCGGHALTAFYREGNFRVLCMGCGNNLTDAFYG